MQSAALDTEATLALDYFPDKPSRMAFDSMVRELLSRGKTVEFATTGRSMRYLIPPGSVALVETCRYESVVTGDVVLLHTLECKAGSYIIHRVISRRAVGGRYVLVTKGDSSTKDLQTFDRDTCYGRLVGIRLADGVVRLDRWYWGPINRLVALLSRLSTIFIGRFAPPPGGRGYKMTLPRRLMHSTIKRVLAIGAWMSVDARGEDGRASGG